MDTNNVEIPKEYLDDQSIMIYRNGVYINVHEHNKGVDKKWEPKQIRPSKHET